MLKEYFKNTLGFTTFSSHKRGFTLIELMITITILAILTITGYTAYSQSQIRGRDVVRKKDLQSIATALEIYYQQNKRYPCTGGGTSAPINELSIDATWLVDKNASTAPCAGSNNNIAPQYINSMPVDPLNNTNYNYLYQSSGGDYSASCRAGQYYFLAATLENPNDQNLYFKKPFDICGINPITWCNSASCKYYIIVP